MKQPLTPQAIRLLDIQGFDVSTADTDGFLRAETFTQVGRVYKLTYESTDVAGNASICQTTVTAALKPTP